MQSRFLKFAADPLRWSMMMAFVIIGGIAWIAQSTIPTSSTTNGKIPSPRAGFLAPDFTLESLHGEQITLSDLRGQVVILNLWASWCPPCRAEMPALQRVYERYGERGLTVLAVNTSFQDSRDEVFQWIEQLGASFVIPMDWTGAVSRLYQMRALPTTFFIDQEGVIREVVIGGPQSEVSLLTQIETLMREMP